MIQIAGSQLSQWDVGRSVSVSDSKATHVHFANQGDSKAPIIKIENGGAKIPDYLLQTGKALLAYAVLDGVTLECKSFAVRKRERPENYVYEDDRRNYIYELITNAEAAVANANLAIQNANEAANKANQAAKSWVMMGEVRGKSVFFDDAVDQTFAGFRIFGKTTQDGTPSPEAPVDLVSVGDTGSITVNVVGGDKAQSMTITTPNGLRGNPVTSGGNYTDSDGRQWICDEVDLTRGVHIQRIEKVVLKGNSSDRYTYNTMYGDAARFDVKGVATYPRSDIVLCTHLPTGSIGSNNAEICNIHGLIGYPIIQILARRLESVDAMGLEKYLAENPITIYYVLADPIETSLSEEEIAAYAELHTYRNNTTVSNDAGAYMELEYVMDAKKYIDSLVIGGGSTSTILKATVE